MESNFDKNFEKNKTSFKEKFGKDWNAEPQLYLTYLNTLYISTLMEIANTGLSKIISMQEDSYKLLQTTSQKIK